MTAPQLAVALDVPDAERAVAAAARLGAELLTIHTSGGATMMRAAVEGRGGDSRRRLLGVTVLTSLIGVDLVALGIDEAPAERVDRLCGLAHEAGCDGVVAVADYLVVGRPILGAPDPVAAANAIRNEMEGARG